MTMATATAFCAAPVAIALVAATLAAAVEPPELRSTVRGDAHEVPAETRVDAAEARHIPGTEGDALKVVESLPGVARATLGSRQLVVWGAATSETKVLVDGVEIPALYHVGGLRTTINSYLLSDVTLTPGGFTAPYGRALGGLLRADTVALSQRGVHGHVAADLLDVSALLSAALGRRLHIAAAARYSWLDLLLGKLVSPKVQSYFPIPRYDDYQAKLTLALRPGEELSALLLASDDHLLRSVPAADPASARADTTDAASYRVALPYRLRSDDGTTTELTPFVGYDHTLSQTRFGEHPTRLETTAVRWGLRGSYRRRVARLFTLALGVDVAAAHTRVVRSGSLTLPPREGDLYVFGQPPSDDLNRDDFSATIVDAAPFVQGELRWRRLTVIAGLRIDADALAGNHVVPPFGNLPVVGFQRLAFAADPRLSLRLRVHRRVVLTAAAGLYHQPPDAADLSPLFGNPTLGLMQAVHATFGLSVDIHEGLSAELVGYYKELDALVSRSALPSPPLGQALLQTGSGRSYGGQILVRQKLWRGLSGWLSYTVGRSERQDHPDGPTRLFDLDQTHVLAVVAGYELGAWSFGARFRYASGFPRTPVVGAYFDARDDLYQPLFGPQNQIRLPDFVQLDLRVDRRFAWPRLALDLYLEILNVTYQRNPEEIVYNERYNQPSYITGLPTLAILGARVSF
jgi:hypothetical protein